MSSLPKTDINDGNDPDIIGLRSASITLEGVNEDDRLLEGEYGLRGVGMKGEEGVLIAWFGGSYCNVMVVVDERSRVSANVLFAGEALVSLNKGRSILLGCSRCKHQRHGGRNNSRCEGQVDRDVG